MRAGGRKVRSEGKDEVGGRREKKKRRKKVDRRKDGDAKI